MSVQNPIELSDASEPQADIAILNYGADFYGTSHPRPYEIVLLIEVSDSSLEYDKENKSPANGSYRTKQTWLHGNTITSVQLNVITAHVDDILG